MGDEETTATLRLRAEGVVAREVDGETVILDLNGSVYFSTNAAGSILWNELARGTTRESLVAALLGEYEVERRRAEVDVDAFIERCSSAGLVEHVLGSSGG